MDRSEVLDVVMVNMLKGKDCQPEELRLKARTMAMPRRSDVFDRERPHIHRHGLSDRMIPIIRIDYACFSERIVQA